MLLVFGYEILEVFLLFIVLLSMIGMFFKDVGGWIFNMGYYVLIFDNLFWVNWVVGL